MHAFSTEARIFQKRQGDRSTARVQCPDNNVGNIRWSATTDAKNYLRAVFRPPC